MLTALEWAIRTSVLQPEAPTETPILAPRLRRLMRVAVTGGTGYVGPALVEEMLRAGHDVVVVEHVQPVPLGPHSRLHRARGGVGDVRALREAFEGCDAVAHLVAILREDKRRGVTFEKVMVRGTRNVVEAARDAGVRRFLFMSANGVGSGMDTPYFRSKLAAERIVEEAGFDHTIFRPSYIAGAQEGGFDRQFADIIDKAPALPSFAGGRFEIQPVSRRNVAQAFARALTRPAAIGKTYALVGPERMTWNEYLRRLARLRGRKRPLVYAPGKLMIAAATVAGPLFPANADALRMLMLGNVGDGSEAVKDLGLELETWDDAVAGLRR